MGDRNDSLGEAKAPPAAQGASHPADDVASLYSWANLHGVKYRDFSASRQEARAQSQYRLLEAGPAGADEPQHGAVITPAREASAPKQQTIPEQQARPEEPARLGGWQELAEPVRPAVPLGTGGVGPAVSALMAVRNAVPQVLPAAPLAPSPDGAHPGSHPGSEAGREVIPPAWIDLGLDLGIDLGMAHRHLAPEPAAKAPKDSLQTSTEAAASLWFVVQGLLAGRSEGEETAFPAPRLQAPVVAIFSVAGGVGKTSLTANVARALAARGEQLLVAETSAFGILPFYFGARDLRPGAVRTFANNVGDVPIHILSLDTEQAGKDRPAHWLQRDLYRASREVSRILIDASGGFHGVIEDVLGLQPVVVIPVLPNMSSVAGLQAVDASFRTRQARQGESAQPYFLLNQFNPTLPLHRDVREELAQKFGDRLLPLVVQRSPLMSEALAEGLTVIDYAPTSQLAEDIYQLAGWIRGRAPADATSLRGVRWSER